MGLWGVYDRYFASTRKVSLLTPPNGPILVERMKIPCDSASEAPCRRDLVLCRGTRRHVQRYSPTGSVSLSRYYPAMGRALGSMAPHCLSHLVFPRSPRGWVRWGVLRMRLFAYSRSIGHKLHKEQNTPMRPLAGEFSKSLSINTPQRKYPRKVYSTAM